MKKLIIVHKQKHTIVVCTPYLLVYLLLYLLMLLLYCLYSFLYGFCMVMSYEDYENGLGKDYQHSLPGLPKTGP